MKKMMKTGIVGLLVLSVLVLPLGSAVVAEDRYKIDEQRKDGAPMFYDAVIVRPLGILATALGTAAWLVGLPFSALGGNVDEATEKLIVEPAKFTFQRPLGEF